MNPHNEMSQKKTKMLQLPRNALQKATRRNAKQDGFQRQQAIASTDTEDNAEENLTLPLEEAQDGLQRAGQRPQ